MIYYTETHIGTTNLASPFEIHEIVLLFIVILSGLWLKEMFQKMLQNLLC